MGTFIELLGGTRSVPVDELMKSDGGLLSGAGRSSDPSQSAVPVGEAAVADAWLPRHQRRPIKGTERSAKTPSLKASAWKMLRRVGSLRRLPRGAVLVRLQKQAPQWDGAVASTQTSGC